MRIRHVSVLSLPLLVACMGSGYLACINADGLDTGVGVVTDGGGAHDATTVTGHDGGTGSDGGCGDADITSDPNNCGACGNVCEEADGAALANGVATCVMSACGVTCSAGFADCNSSVADGCEARTEDDPLNCGACGHDCGGSSCSGGMCQPSVLLQAPPDGGSPAGLQVLDAGVYFDIASPPALYSLPKAGGAAAQLLGGGATSFGSLLAMGDTFYVGDSTGVIDTYTSGVGAGAAVSTGSEAVRHLTHNATQFFAATPTYIYAYGPAVGDAGVTGPTAIATPPAAVFSFVATATDVIFPTQAWIATAPAAGANTADVLYRCPLAGCIADMTTGLGGPTVFASAQSRPFSMAVDASNVYWSVDNTANGDGAIMACAISGCPSTGPVALASGLAEPEYLTSDGTTVYFTNIHDGTIRAVGVPTTGAGTADGGGPSLTPSANPVRLVVDALRQPTYLATDDTYLYWVETGGRVMRVRK